ncbi:hypothetical protein JCM3765_000976, partial [Sporobolomyces pararoseus]
MSGYDPPYPVYTDPNFPPTAPAYSTDQHQHQPQPYDPYGGSGSVVDHSGHEPGTADYSNPQQYRTHDPFSNPPPHSQSTQWAQPVPSYDLGDPYQHPLGPPHSNSFDSTNNPHHHNQPHYSDPFSSQAHLATSQSHLGGNHQDPTDDEPDSAPLLHNRWSTQP